MPRAPLLTDAGTVTGINRDRSATARRRVTDTTLVQEDDMADLVFVGLAVGFFALSWGLVRLCERL